MQSSKIVYLNYNTLFEVSGYYISALCVHWTGPVDVIFYILTILEN